MAYRVVSGGWAGGNGLASSTQVLTTTPALFATYPGFVSAAVNIGSSIATFYYHDAINGAALTDYAWPPLVFLPGLLGNQLTQQVTLASMPIGSQVLIQTGRATSGGWELGTVIDDGTSLLIGGVPVPHTARAVFPLLGAPRAGSFALAAITADGRYWFANIPLTLSVAWKSVVVTITNAGALGTMTFSWTVGSSQGSSGSTAANSGSNFVLTIPGTNLALQFAPGTYVLGSSYTTDTTGTIALTPTAISTVSIFSVNLSGPPPLFNGTAVTTLGALSPGNVALVETSLGVWQIVTI